MTITTAVLTGDVINSRKEKPEVWLSNLKKALNKYGKEPKNWEIYRGDSFQLEVTTVDALEAAIYIKAQMKQKKNIDVRIAIGLGEKDYDAEKLTESNGSAFVHSGECFQNLKKQNLALKSGIATFDKTLNLMLKLATLTMDNWLPATSRVVKTAMDNPNTNQNELASILDKSQSNISEALIRAGFDEVKKMMQFYRTQLQQL
jgi:hypothetical protein